MSEALPYIGAAIGSFFTGGIWGISYASWGFMAGSLLSSAMGGSNQQGPRLEDRNIIGTAYGQAVPWLAGKPRLTGQIVWASPVREIAQRKKVGKGGGSKYTTFTYECDVMILLSENVTTDVARDWLNAELVRSEVKTKEGIWASYVVYTGADDQLPDPTYEAAVGVGNAPAYRGRTSIVITGLQLTNGKQIPNLEHQANTVSGIDLSGARIYMPLTNVTELGDQLPPAQNATPSASGVFTSLDFKTTGVELQWSFPNGGQTRFQFPADGGDFDVAHDFATTDRYIALDYNFFDMEIRSPVGGPSYANGATQFWIFSDGLNSHRLSIRDHDSVSNPGASFDLVWHRLNLPEPEVVATNFPLTGRLGIVFPAGTLHTMEIYVDNSLFMTVVSPNALAVGSRSWAFGAVGVTDMRGAIFASFRLSRLYCGYGTDPVYQPTLETNVKATVDALLVRAGYMPNEFQVHEDLYDVPLEGYATGDVSGTRAHLETLRPYAKYEAFCTDRLYISPRATVPVMAVDWSDLGANEDADPGEPFPLVQGNESELPAQIALRYRNAHADYAVGTEFSDRIDSSMVSTRVVEMAFGMTPAQAKNTVTSMLLDLMAGLGRVTLRVGGRKYARVQPGQIITTTNPQGRTYRLRVITKRDSLVVIEWDCALDDASVLNPPDPTYEGYVPAEPVLIAPTEWQTVNIPALRDADADAPGPYVAITPGRSSAADEWPGAVFVRARLPEAYEQEFITGDSAVIGETTTALASHAGGSWSLQHAGKVRVRVRGELSSSTLADMAVDRTINAAVIGDEPLRFVHADFIGNDGLYRIYDLSQFLRGQLGQEHKIVEHPSGARFVLLDSMLRRMVNETTDIGVEQQVKAVTLNLLLSSVIEEEFADSGISLMPYSPWRLRAHANAGGDLEVSADRRSRLVARYTTTGTFAPLGETLAAFRFKVYDGLSLVRTHNDTDLEWTYSAAEIAADGFTSGDPITITAQQLSDTVGEGFAATLETSAP
ncbi:phage tail protein [Hydrogenophaga sp. ANAO-22]|uniref:phage tail protein n=1 Tax=Hydrogenophaga sp. ANAO-22 TaxID=3166645 RepID=UPI0036D43F56